MSYLNKHSGLIATLSISINILLIVFLLFFRHQAQQKLDQVAVLMDELGETHIIDTVRIRDTVAVNTEFLVSRPVPVNVQLRLKSTLALKTLIPVDQRLDVPITLHVRQHIKVDTAVLIDGELVVPVDAVIPIDQTFTLRTRKNGRGIKLPIVAEIPLKQDIRLSFRDPLPFRTSIAVDIPINETIPIDLTLNIPVDQDLPVDMPVNSAAQITFPSTLPIKGSIPLSLDVPIDIPLGQTELKEKAHAVGETIRRLLDIF